MQCRTQNAIYQLRTFLLGDILQPVVHRKFNTMKKLLLAIFSFYGLSVASAAYVGGTDYDTDGGTVTLKDANSWATNGSFAVSFELSQSLKTLADTGRFDYSLTLGDGASKSFRVDFSVATAPWGGYMFAMTATNGKKSVTDFPTDIPDSKGPFVVQYNEDKHAVSLSYMENGILETMGTVEINDTFSLPTTVNVSKMEFVQDNVAIESPVEEVVTWQGEVTAEEVANPSAVPTVPEPATATLSLLALCGLAARRRR